MIDALSADPLWGPRLTLDKVGVHGMSAGGVTGLSVAGAQWRLLNLVQHCQTHAQADESFCFQGAITAEKRQARQAMFDQAKGVPETYLPATLTAWHGGRTAAAGADARPDPRVAAVSLAVPLAAMFSAESQARIVVPVGVVSADQDQVLVPRFHSDHILAHCKTCVRLADLTGGGHFDVLWPWPESVAREVAAAQVRGGLPVAGFDPDRRDRAQDLIVAFHRQPLQGSH